MSSGCTWKILAQAHPLLRPSSPASMQSKAIRQSQSATPNLDDRDSLFSDLSAPLTDKPREKLSRLEELYSSRDSANGSLRNVLHLRDDDQLVSRWSSDGQCQQCPVKLTAWSPTLSDADMKRGNSLSPRRTTDDDDGYSVYSDWDSYHLASDRSRTRPKMTEVDRRRDSAHEAFNRLSGVISCALVTTNPEVPARSAWDHQQSFWADLLKNGGISIEQKYDPACPTDIGDACAVRPSSQGAEPRASLLLDGDRDIRNAKLEVNNTTAQSPRNEVKGLRKNNWSLESVQPGTRAHRIGRTEEEKRSPRSRSNRRRGTHSRSRSPRTSPRASSFRSRRISRFRESRSHHSSERHRTTSEGERTSMSHLENKSSKGNNDRVAIEKQNDGMISEKEFLRIVRSIHSGQLEPAMRKTLLQIVPEVISRHTCISQTSVNIEEVSQDTKDIVWQLQALSPSASFHQILSSIPFLRKLFFQFKLPDTSTPVRLPPSSKRRPSTLSPEKRRPEPEIGSPSHRHRKKNRDSTPDLYPARQKFRRRLSTDRPDRRRSESRRFVSHGRSTPPRPSTLHRPLVTPREWLLHRRTVFGSKYALVRHSLTVHRRHPLRSRASVVRTQEMITRSRNDGRVSRGSGTSERHRPEERVVSDREEQHRRSPLVRRNQALHRRLSTPTLRPKASKRSETEQNHQHASFDRASKPLALANTAMDPVSNEDISKVSTSKTSVSKDESVAQVPQSNINTTQNRMVNTTRPNDSDHEKPSKDCSVTRPRVKKPLLKPPNLLSYTVAIPRNITPLQDLDLGRSLPGIKVPLPVLLPRPPLLPTPHRPTTFPNKPLFPLSSCLNYSRLRQPTRCLLYGSEIMCRLPGPPKLKRPSGDHVLSDVRPLL